MKTTSRPCLALGLLMLFTAASELRADQIEMQNGDRYVGKVVSMNTNTLTLQSEVLGTVRLPRQKIALINLGSTAVPKPVSGPPKSIPATAPAPTVSKPVTQTNTPVDSAPSLRQLGNHPELIQKVQAEYLADASPEATAKFNELLGSLASGKMSVNDLRNEAKSAADQLRQLQRELGPEADSALDGYLSILDNFIQETVPSNSSPAKPTVAPPKPKPPPAAKADE